MVKRYRVLRKVREKKEVGERWVKVRGVELGVDVDLVVKVMAPEDLYKD